MIPEQHFDLLRRMPVFGGLCDGSLQLILSRGRMVTWAAGEYLFHEGAGAESFFVLEQGTVIVERQWEGKTLCLGRLKRGDCIGEMAIIDLLPRSASVRAEVNCVAIEITLASLRELYQQNVEQYAIIMMNMGREVSRRLRRTDDRLLALEQQLASSEFSTLPHAGGSGSATSDFGTLPHAGGSGCKPGEGQTLATSDTSDCGTLPRAGGSGCKPGEGPAASR